VYNDVNVLGGANVWGKMYRARQKCRAGQMCRDECVGQDKHIEWENV